MASPLTISSLAGGVFDGVAKIIQLFKIPPEQAAANAIELQKIQDDMLQASQRAAQAQIDDATQNIQAEARAGSKARPAFMYIIEVILFVNYVCLPIYHVVSGKSFDPFPLPTNLLALFGVCLCGYTAFDKVAEIMNLPGSSIIQVPGLKITNDGPTGGKKK